MGRFELVDHQTWVSIIIPCYGQAQFLPEAIESARAQTHAHIEIVVVDDGSPDDTAAVAQRYAGVRYVRQSNQGLAAARNTGIRESTSPYLVFLDADDRLLPNAVEAGLACFMTHPDSAFVSGGFHFVDQEGRVFGEPVIPSITTDHAVEMLKRNYIGMIATVMFRRDVLASIHAFNASLKVCEDLDLYLRIIRHYPVRCYGSIVAEYRRHTSNVSNNSGLMLRTALHVLRSHRPGINDDRRQHAAYRAGMRFWKEKYGRELMQEVKRIGWQQPGRAFRNLMTLVRFSPAFTARKLGEGMARMCRTLASRTARAALPGWMVRRLRPLRGEQAEPIPLGCVDMGDLHRLTPVSQVFGFDRGLPIDRYYIEAFLLRQAVDIAGRVLEVADNGYTVRFGGDRVTHSDILHVNADHPLATFVGDLTDAPQLPSDTFNCVILTQTLHLIYDMKAAMQTLHRILKPGGVLLLTVPGVTRVEHGVRGNNWFWTFTHDSIRRLVEEVFPAANVHVEDHGNVFSAVAFLHGLAIEEVSTGALDYHDSAYQVIVAARAMKPHATP